MSSPRRSEPSSQRSSQAPKISSHLWSQKPFWLYFPEQWDAKSPWSDLRVRQAARLSLDLKTINQALTLGFSHIHGSLIPDNFEFFWKPPATPYDPDKARQF